jgi:choloylglycine hydrolase
MKAKVRWISASLAFLSLIIIGLKEAHACTAFVLRGRSVVLLAKNLDWPVGDGYLFVNKRGVDKKAFGRGPGAALRWTSRYGSVTFNQFGREFPLGGINEAGLAVEELNGPADYPPPDERPFLNELQWIQYHLDTCRSVKEVIKRNWALRISRALFKLHYLVADRKGNTAVIEFSGGKMVSYSGDALTVPVLANNDYPESLRYLGLHKGFGGDRAVSNGPESGERFVRAATILSDLRWLGQRAFVDDAFVTLKAVEQADTQWSIAYSIPGRRIFFKTREHRRYKIISLEALDFSCASPVLMLPVNTPEAGNLARNLIGYDGQKNRDLVISVFRQLRESGEIDEQPADDLAQGMASYPETCRCRLNSKSSGLQ